MRVTGVRTLTAPNPGFFTLDGTRTYVVGDRRVAVIDPGPQDEGHLESITGLTARAESVVILLTHDHADHAAGATALAEMVGGLVYGPGGPGAVEDSSRFGTDAGALVAVSTPGHTEEHFCYHLPEAGAVFVGDLLLGEGDTTWVGEYDGGVADYLASLVRLETLEAGVLFPGHGPPLVDAAGAIARFRGHRTARIDQVSQVLDELQDASVAQILERVYGGIPESLLPAARRSIEAILDYLGQGE